MPGALEIVLGQREAGLSELFFGEGAVKLGLVGPGVDYEKQVALLHSLAVFKMYGLQIAAHARPHVHRIHGLETPGVFVPLHDLLGHGLAHRDLGRRGRRGLVLPASVKR